MKNTTKIAFLLFAAAILAGFNSVKAQGWKANPKYMAQAKTDTTRHAAKQFQCFGTCKDGHRCNRKVSTDKSFCYQHQNQAK